MGQPWCKTLTAGSMDWLIELKLSPDPENSSAVNCLIVCDSPWDTACGLGVTYYHYTASPKLTLSETPHNSQWSKEWSNKKTCQANDWERKLASWYTFITSEMFFRAQTWKCPCIVPEQGRRRGGLLRLDCTGHPWKRGQISKTSWHKPTFAIKSEWLA